MPAPSYVARVVSSVLACGAIGFFIPAAVFVVLVNFGCMFVACEEPGPYWARVTSMLLCVVGCATGLTLGVAFGEWWDEKARAVRS